MSDYLHKPTKIELHVEYATGRCIECVCGKSFTDTTKTIKKIFGPFERWTDAQDFMSKSSYKGVPNRNHILSMEIREVKNPSFSQAGYDKAAAAEKKRNAGYRKGDIEARKRHKKEDEERHKRDVRHAYEIALAKQGKRAPIKRKKV